MIMKCLQCLLKPIFYRVLGFICFSVFIVMAGPLIGFGDARPLESASMRYLLVGLLACLLLMPLVFKRLIVRVRSQHLLKSLISSIKLSSYKPGGAVGSPSEQAMVESFQEGLTALQSRTHRKAFYQLPW